MIDWRYIIRATAALSIALSASLAGAQVDESVLQGVVKIVTTRAGDSRSIGAGIIVQRDASSAWILTAAHVVAKPNEIRVFFRSDANDAPGTRAERRHTQSDSLEDTRGFALLRVTGAAAATTAVLTVDGSQRPPVGVPILVIGHQPIPGEWRAISGSISGVANFEIDIQGPIEAQSSGGPIVLGGRVVGLVQARRGSGFGVASPASQLQAYLSDQRIAQQEVKPVAKPEPVAPPQRQIVINGPKPLYAGHKTGDVFQECAQCPEMVVIVPDPKGFTIGSPASEAGRDADEQQFGPVRFARPYAIGRFEVTRGQFAASGLGISGCHWWDGKAWVLNETRSWEQPGFAQDVNHPVVCVSWNDSRDYLKWLNAEARAANVYRLPSEAEWEYAARGGTTTARYWGDRPELACGYANVADQDAGGKLNWTRVHECRDGFVYTAPVGRYKPNGYGLYDMLGNTWEWTQDCYSEKYVEAIRSGNAFESGECNRRVARGGAWYNDSAVVRTAKRYVDLATLREQSVGLRVARTLP